MDETIFKLLLAFLVGALIGAEREFRVGMGLRIMVLICPRRGNVHHFLRDLCRCG